MDVDPTDSVHPTNSADKPLGPTQIFTVGHSNHSTRVFLDLLQSHGVMRLADVRRYPSSRRNPQHSQPTLEPALAARRIDYRHYPGLGGYRKASLQSPHTAWEEDAFRAYADHMASPEFEAALDELEQWALPHSVAIMCAEASPSHCHRKVLSDALKLRGFRVLHIPAEGPPEEHRYPSFARIDEGRLIYDGGMLPFG